MTDSPEILILWRIVGQRNVDSAYSGEGAEKFGGRFNSKGRRLVYASGSLSLALLESLVQTNSRERLKNHLCVSAAVRSEQVLFLTQGELPNDWDNRPFSRASQIFGDHFLDEMKSLVLRVPSVVNPLEFNYLINPLHPDFGTIKIAEPIPLPVDHRLLD